MIAVTHNGIFHADDVFAWAVIANIFNDCELIRTRNPNIIKDANIVFDVGGEYDENTDRFDHHQKGGPGIVRQNGIPYSSFGIVWKKYGTHYCASETIAQLVDEQLVQFVDAIDNGVDLTENLTEVNTVSISNILSGFNPNWYESSEEEDFYNKFIEAAGFAETVLNNTIRSITGTLKAKNIVNMAIEEAVENNSKVLIFNQFVPWKSEVLGNENAENIQFVVYPDIGGEWRIMTIPESEDSFKARKDLPESWAGLHGEELNNIIGINDAVFCHNGRFIAGAKTEESILKMAELAIKE